MRFEAPPDQLSKEEYEVVEQIKRKRNLAWQRYLEIIGELLGIGRENSAEKLSKNEIHSIRLIQVRSKKMWIHCMKSVKVLRRELKSVVSKTIDAGLGQEGHLHSDEKQILDKQKLKSTNEWRSRIENVLNWAKAAVDDVAESVLFTVKITHEEGENSSRIIKAFVLACILINITTFILWNLLKYLLH